jgi:hypothetical protein
MDIIKNNKSLILTLSEHSKKSFSPSFRFIPNRGPRLKELKMGLNMLAPSHKASEHTAGRAEKDLKASGRAERKCFIYI